MKSAENKNVSPKFKTVFIEKKEPFNKKIKQLMHWCTIFQSEGLAPSYGKGTYGNLSFRISRSSLSFIITASGLGEKNELSKADFVKVEKVDLDKKIVYICGMKKPSSESLLHYAIYKKRPDAGAIFHGHCQQILNCTEKLGIPSTLKEEPYGSIRLVKSVLEVLSYNKMIIMKNHGFLSLGKEMDEAGKLAISILHRTTSG